MPVPVAWCAGEPLTASSDARAQSAVVIQWLRVGTADPLLGAQGYRRASMTHAMIPREPTNAQDTFAAVFGDRHRPVLRVAGRWRFMARFLHLSSEADAMFAAPVARRLGTCPFIQRDRPRMRPARQPELQP
jgi:hypothetical protein